MNNFRSLLYKLARGLGDLNALFKGKIGSRIFNKLMGRGIASKLWSRGGCLLPVAVVVAVCALLLI